MIHDIIILPLCLHLNSGTGGFMGGVHMCSYGGSLLASLHTKVSAFIIII